MLDKRIGAPPLGKPVFPAIGLSIALASLLTWLSCPSHQNTGEPDAGGQQDGGVNTDGGLDADEASGETCAEIRARFKAQMPVVIACDKDEECVVHNFGAPFIADCYTAVNQSADLAAADDAAAAYVAAGCSPHEYDCPDHPPPEIRCTLTHECRFMGEEYPECGVLRGAFAEEADRLNHCQDASDCVLVMVRNCGIMVACWIPIDGDEDQTLLRQVEDEYGIMLCPYATCSCPLPYLICEGGKCVEIYP